MEKEKKITFWFHQDGGESFSPSPRIAAFLRSSKKRKHILGSEIQ
jgi:hypothetical protein